MARPDPGKMDTKIRVERPHVTRDAAGAAVIEWRPVCNAWAERIDVSGSERFSASQRLATVTTIWRMWWRGDIDPTCRIVTRDQDIERAYGIEAVNELGRREGIDVLSSARAEHDANQPAQLDQ
jgi:head-tail adaptor